MIESISKCATMGNHYRLAKAFSGYRRERRDIEEETKNFVALYGRDSLRTSVVRIPVVVHILWDSEEQNISDQQIHSQIDVLNADFRKNNADAQLVPEIFSNVAADTRIEFSLAVRDPQCMPTNGITRTRIKNNSFTITTVNNTKSSPNGADPWPSDRYLNIWVVNFTDGTLGMATFPSGMVGEPQFDGVVIDIEAFGTADAGVFGEYGNLLYPVSPHDLGRTATHEVGHWLNLLHIWGGDGACDEDDECDDTPNQDKPTYGAPFLEGFSNPTTEPPSSCGTSNMFMNYMDYTDDSKLFMFTEDQALRMNAALSLHRTGILASDGLIPPPDESSKSYLWMKDTIDDTGAEPNSSTDFMYLSDDIWIRSEDNGLENPDHQNPRTNQVNYVYVRVRNRGCNNPDKEEGCLRLYWAKASTSLSWPAPWDSSVTSPALMGGEIESGKSVEVAARDSEIIKFQWTPPNPSDYASFGADKAHFCLLARIETSGGMTVRETGDLVGNVRNNNRIAWKNISIVDTDRDGARFSAVVIGNFGGESDERHLIFETPKRRGVSLFDWGHILVEFRGDALAGWVKDGRGFQQLADGRIIISQAGAQLIGHALKQGTFGTLRVQFIPDGRITTGAEVLELDVTELDSKGKLIGGQRFLLKTAAWRKQLNYCGDAPYTFDGVIWKPKGGCC